jgi:hypothetical protein
MKRALDQKCPTCGVWTELLTTSRDGFLIRRKFECANGHRFQLDFQEVVVKPRPTHLAKPLAPKRRPKTSNFDTAAWRDVIAKTAAENAAYAKDQAAVVAALSPALVDALRGLVRVYAIPDQPITGAASSLFTSAEVRERWLAAVQILSQIPGEVS